MRVWLSLILYASMGFGNSMPKTTVRSLGVQVYGELNLNYGTK